MTVLLTADRTLMSKYHGKEFLGFGSTAPPNILPEWFFKALFFPPIGKRNGMPLEAPYGLRKIEAQLLMEGLDVVTVDPDSLARFIDKAKALGIHVMDPFGWGPSSTTFAGILKTGEPYAAKYFRQLLEKREVKKAKKHGLKIIVGGPGAWQFKYKPQFLNAYGIDCVVDGEAEKVVGKIFKAALNGEELPRFYDVQIKETPSLDEIPEIRNPSINGLIEIGRGCCRGCRFCSVTQRPLRWYPYEKIRREIEVNANAGLNYGILHAEDVLLYGSKNTVPQRNKVLKLHRLCKRLMGGVGWSHTSMAAAAADPKLLREVADIIVDGRQEWWGAQVGIETGSPNLLRKAMPAKALPFKPEQWQEVVVTAMGAMHDCNLIPACTLITGLPQEKEEDVTKTIELVDNLKEFRSLIVPLFFVPLGKLKKKEWFKTEEMTSLHMELLVKCLKHDLHWAKVITESYFAGWRRLLLKPFYQLFIKMVERKARQVNVISYI